MLISRHPLHAFAAILFIAVPFGGALPLRAQDPASLTIEQKIEFLRTGKIVGDKSAKKGITDTQRVTLTDGKLTHDASVQRIDEHRDVFQGQDGSSEFNFKDSWKFNVAAWKLARLLGLDDMMPPYIERKFKGDSASYSWWVDDVMMDEETRTKKNMTAPDLDAWNQEMYVVRVFDQLIYNTDRNLTNLLVDKNWHIWMIDHSRSFRAQHTLRNDKNLVRCDRALLARMKALDAATLKKELSPYVNGEEIKGLLARRDLIVKFFESKGESALYDRPKRS